MPRYAELVYNGMWFAPERLALQAAIDATQQFCTGTVRLKLYKVARLLPRLTKVSPSIFLCGLACESPFALCTRMSASLQAPDSNNRPRQACPGSFGRGARVSSRRFMRALSFWRSCCLCRSSK